MEQKTEFQVPAKGLKMLILQHRQYAFAHKSVHHDNHPKNFSFFLFVISILFYKKDFEKFSLLKKSLIFLNKSPLKA